MEKEIGKVEQENLDIRKYLKLLNVTISNILDNPKTLQKSTTHSNNKYSIPTREYLNFKSIEVMEKEIFNMKVKKL